MVSPYSQTPALSSVPRAAAKSRSPRSHGRLRFVNLFVLSVSPFLLPALPAQQPSHSLGNISFGNADHSPHTDPEHLIQGVVADKTGKAMAGAMVYLKSSRNTSVQVVFTDEKGGYRFGPLALETDYTVWAKAGDKVAAAKPVSAFTTGPVTIQLTLP